MYAPKQIIVPVDFSPPSRAAARRAALLGRSFDVPLHLLHALDAEEGDEDTPRRREEASEQLRRLERDLGDDGAAVSSELVEGDPVEAIGASADRHGANLIVIGNPRHGALTQVFLGSVANATLRTVDCPILTVNESEEDAALPIQRIVHATDFSVHSKRAARVAQGLAKQFGASVSVVHVFALPQNVIGPYGVPPEAGLVERLRNEAGARLEQVSHVFENSGIPCEAQVLDGVPSEVVAREAERIGANLIVLGTRGNTGLKHVFLGSVAERTIRIARCSVLTTKDGDPL